MPNWPPTRWLWFVATVLIVVCGLGSVWGWAFDLEILPKPVWIGGVFVALAVSKITSDRWRGG